MDVTYYKSLDGDTVAVVAGTGLDAVFAESSTWSRVEAGTDPEPAAKPAPAKPSSKKAAAAKPAPAASNPLED